MLNLMVEENARAKEANATALAARRRNHGEAAELEQKLSAARKVMVSLNEARKLEHQMLSGDVSFASIDGLKKLAGSLSRRLTQLRAGQPTPHQLMLRDCLSASEDHDKAHLIEIVQSLDEKLHALEEKSFSEVMEED